MTTAMLCALVVLSGMVGGAVGYVVGRIAGTKAQHALPGWVPERTCKNCVHWSRPPTSGAPFGHCRIHNKETYEADTCSRFSAIEGASLKPAHMAGFFVNRHD